MEVYRLHKLWAWLPMAGITFGKHVFVKDLTDQLTINHELVHVKQQREHRFWFWFSYVFFPLPFFWNPWRMKWEAEAYAVQARAGCPVEGPNSLSAVLSGAMYGWCCRKQRAADAIRRWL